MIQCSQLHYILIFVLFSGKIRKSAQCRTGLQADRLSGEFKGKSAVQDEAQNPSPRLKSYYHQIQTNQESQNVNEYSSPVSKAEEASSVEVPPNTPPSSKNDTFEQPPKDPSEIIPSSTSLISPKVATPHHDVKPKVAEISPTPSSESLSKPHVGYGKQQSMIITRDLLIAISVLALSMLSLGIIWFALIVFQPMIRSSRMRLKPRSWFKKNTKPNDPPQWWTQFPINSQLSEAEALSITRNFTGGANAGRSQFGSTSEMVAAFTPRKVSWNMHTGLTEQVEVLEDPESQWKPDNAPSGENPIPHSRLETWLRGTDEMRGKLFLATSVFQKDPSLCLTKESALMRGLPSLGPSDSASRL
ncbi:hypothetical protein PGTUg99_009373 [Puccinia graminis f. sp. tritici]|nr:hypothetical protein PGTUg99_009373 [Puccinia graminis f. sp. tritici]